MSSNGRRTADMMVMIMISLHFYKKKLVVCKVGLRSRCLRDNVMTGSARDETGDRSVSLSLYLRSRS